MSKKKTDDETVNTCPDCPDIPEEHCQAIVEAQLNASEQHAEHDLLETARFAKADNVSPRSLVQGLVNAGVDWRTILFKALPMILMLIPGGAPFAEILAQLLAIFAPNAPTPPAA